MAVRRDAHKALSAPEHRVTDELNEDAWPDEDLPADDDIAVASLRSSSDVVDAPIYDRVGCGFDGNEVRRSLDTDRPTRSLERRADPLRKNGQYDLHDATDAECENRPALLRCASRGLIAQSPSGVPPRGAVRRAFRSYHSWRHRRAGVRARQDGEALRTAPRSRRGSGRTRFARRS